MFHRKTMTQFCINVEKNKKYKLKNKRVSFLEEKIEVFRHYIEESIKIVFFGGAGVSTESGLPDFRGQDGLYRMKYRYPPEEILSHSFFYAHTQEFFEFYREKMALQVQPNITHRKLAKLEQSGKLQAIVTQNIDGLHQAAGSSKVYELHGSIHRNYCLSCGKRYSLKDILAQEGIPHCSCGGIIKPDVVLYGETLDEQTLEGAIQAIRKADLLIVAGTSLSVYPAAGLIRYCRSGKMVLINKTPTSMDSQADLLLPCALGQVFGGIEI